MQDARIEIGARVEDVEGPLEDRADGIGGTVDSRYCALGDELDELDTAVRVESLEGLRQSLPLLDQDDRDTSTTRETPFQSLIAERASTSSPNAADSTSSPCSK